MTFDLAARLDLFGLTSGDLDQVRSHAPALEGHVETVVAAFYAHLETGEVAPLLRRLPLDALQARRRAHWRALLNADFAAIRESTLTRGQTCALDEGLPRSVFAVAGAWFAVAFTEIVAADESLDAATRAALGRTLTRIAFLDAALCEESRNFAWID